MNARQAYLNGTWIAADDLAISVDDLGFLLGVMVAERLRTFRGRVFELDVHLDRMRRSLEFIGLDAPRIAVELAEAVPEFLRRNGQQIDADDDWSLVALVTPGTAGGRPTVCVHGHPLLFAQWAHFYEAGLSLVVSDWRQVPPNCWPPELKCRSRMHYYLADRQAAATRPGARALLLDQQNNVGETPTANVIAYRASEGLLSPPDEHILAGVSLGVVEQLASRLEVPFTKRHFTVDELQQADEAMIASTSICLLPVVELDARPIGSGAPGPMYGRLLQAWGEMVGVDIAEQARRFGGTSQESRVKGREPAGS